MGQFGKLFAKSFGVGKQKPIQNKLPPAFGLRPTAATQQPAQSAVVATAAPSDPESQFLAGQLRLNNGTDFNSSNVEQVWYDPANFQVFVTYQAKRGRPQSTYRYWTVSQTEAADMFRASSKGTEIWDTFRVRGSKTGHKKSYAKV
jgi:hypothetical protein